MATFAGYKELLEQKLAEVIAEATHFFLVPRVQQLSDFTLRALFSTTGTSLLGIVECDLLIFCSG